MADSFYATFTYHPTSEENKAMYVSVTSDAQEAAEYITAGRVVAFPTGTSYGLAVDVLQGHALQRVRNLKQRPEEKTFTIFMKEELYENYLSLSPMEQAFLKDHAGQAFTVLVEPKPMLSYMAQDGRVGIRIIDHPLMQELANVVSVPLTATSANRSGTPACFDTACITQSFPGKVSEELLSTYEKNPRGAKDTTYDLSLACILDGGTLPSSDSSTIVKIENERIVVVREGKGKI